MRSNVVFRNGLSSSQIFADDLTTTPNAVHFFYSATKLRRAAFVVLALVAPALLTVPVNIPGVRLAGLAWLVAMLWISTRLARAAMISTAVLIVDCRGITDHRLGLRLRWQDIAGICRVDTERASVVDIIQRWPQVAVGTGTWRIRFGWWCQQNFGVPAVTLSMLFLDGRAGDLVAAIAVHRPDLLARGNRAAGHRDVAIERRRP